MDIIISLASGIIGGGIISSVLNHLFHRSNVVSERHYLFLKEEFFKYQQISEKLMQKLILLDNHREGLLNYVKYSYEESLNDKSKFIDLTDTFNKDIFEQNQDEIAAFIFLYFPQIQEDWNVCLVLMESLYNTAILIPINNQYGTTVEWGKLINDFNQINTDIGNLPNDISNKIKNEIGILRNGVIEQKSKFKLI